MNQKEQNLYTALKLFITEIREDFYSMLLREFGPDRWEEKYLESFRYQNQREEWSRNTNSGIEPKDLIDFGNLEMFSDRYKQANFFYKKFGAYQYRIPTWFKDISDARNELMHFIPLRENRMNMAFIHMEEIAKILEKNTLNDQLKKLNNIKQPIKELNIINQPIQTNERIGQFVQNSFRRLFDEGRLSNDEILNLQNPDYCRRVFNAGFEVLRKSSRTRLDHLGRPRYYVREITPNYWLSSQWYERQREPFLRWMRSILNN